MSTKREREHATSLAQPLMTDQQLADFLNVSARTLRRQRCQGIGIPYVKFGTGKSASVRYYMPHVLAYLEEHKCVPSVEAAFSEVSRGTKKAQ